MIVLECNYSKKIGLPNYSSHQFSVSIKAELADITQIEQESSRLYEVLQQSVDNNIQTVGYLPSQNGAVVIKSQTNGHQNGNGNHNGNGQPKPLDDKWACSPKQRELILKIITEAKLEKTQVEQLAQDRFGVGVRQLNKLQASGLIEELLAETGQSKPRNQRFTQKAGAR
jgi:hypothetical protein